MEKIKKNYVFLSLSSAIFLLFYMVISKTALFSDGGYWIYQILNGKWFHQDYPHQRFTTYLLQLPSVLTINLNPTFMGKELAIFLFNFFYIFHPVISIGFCYLITRKENRSHLLIYPLLTTASVVFSTLLFGVGIASESLSFFWPLLFIILKKKTSFWDLLIATFLSLTISFSYELSVGLLLLCLFTNIIHSEKTYTRKLLSLALTAGLLNILFTIYNLYFFGTKNFWFLSSFVETWTINLKILLAMGLLFFICSYLSSKNIRYASLIFYCLSLIILGFGILEIVSTTRVNELMWAAHHARTIVVPSGFIIAIMMLLLEGYFTKVTPLFEMSNQVREFLIMSTIFILNFGTIYNFIVTINWRKGLNEVKAEMGRREMCHVIDRKYFEERLLPLGISEWTLPQLTASLSEDLRIKTLLFSEMKLNGKELLRFNSCNSLFQGRLYAKEARYIPFNFFTRGKTIFDFTHVVKNVTPFFPLSDSVDKSASPSSIPFTIFANGLLQTEKHKMTKGKTYVISIRHSSTGLDGQYAHVLIRVEGKVIHEFYSQPEIKAHSFNFIPVQSGDFSFEIIFDNDRWESGTRDINLNLFSFNVSPLT